MNIVSRECYNLEGSIMDKRAEVLSQELGTYVASIGVRVAQIVQQGVPVYEIKTKRGMVEDRSVNEFATDLISIEYTRDGEHITEIWEGITECTDADKHTVYVYLIELLAKLD
jgi:hypothetical protein